MLLLEKYGYCYRGENCVFAHGSQELRCSQFALFYGKLVTIVASKSSFEKKLGSNKGKLFLPQVDFLDQRDQKVVQPVKATIITTMFYGTESEDDHMRENDEEDEDDEDEEESDTEESEEEDDEDDPRQARLNLFNYAYSIDAHGRYTIDLDTSDEPLDEEVKFDGEA